MTRRRRPFRTVDPRVPVAGPGAPQDLGFIPKARGYLSNLKREVAGLRDRLRFRYTDGEPFCYVGEKVFNAEDGTFSLETARVAPPSGIGAAVAQGPLTASYVVRDAQTHEVPVVIPGPGVFWARYLHVEFYQRLYGRQTIRRSTNAEDGALIIDGNIYTGKEMWLQIPWGKTFMQSTSMNPLETGKVHMMAYQGFATSWAGDRSCGGINFFWNLVDRDSERRLSEELIADRVLLPQGYQNEVDGDLLEFGAPLLFERGGRMDFQFRLITPIVQLAPTALPYDSAAGGGAGDRGGTLPIPSVDVGNPTAFWDDREPNPAGGLRRNQAVKVRVELHGVKFFTERDELLRESV